MVARDRCGQRKHTDHEPRQSDLVPEEDPLNAQSSRTASAGALPVERSNLGKSRRHQLVGDQAFQRLLLMQPLDVLDKVPAPHTHHYTVAPIITRWHPSGNQCHSVALSGTQRHPVAISRRPSQRHSAPNRTLSGNQWQSVAISGNQWQSVAISANQCQSVPISGHPNHTCDYP